MSPTTNGTTTDAGLTEHLEREHRQRLDVNRLRREVFEQQDPAASPDLLDQLQAAENELATLEAALAKAHAAAPTNNGLVFDNRRKDGLLLGPKTTGLEARVEYHLAHVPTSTYHLFDAGAHPLVRCWVRNQSADQKTRRLRVTSFIDGYSARAVDTIELDHQTEHTFSQLPTLFPDRTESINELTRATLNVLVEDLDSKTVEIHKSEPIWLLARTTAPLAIKDPATGKWKDLTRYLAAFVTPNAPEIMTFLREAARRHPEKRLVGYQGKPESVETQIEALFEALKANADITYVNSLIAFSPEEGAANQRVRLPRESLADKQANCIDGTVLFASLLEGISMNPAIILVPGHAFVGWETWKRSGEWAYLETTMIATSTYEQARASAEALAKRYETESVSSGNSMQFRRQSLSDLRTTHRITPME